MTYETVLQKSREVMGPYCKSCPICNGKACRNQIPGPGAKGVGETAIRNYDAWQKIYLNMDTIVDNVEADTRLNIHSLLVRLELCSCIMEIFMMMKSIIMF